MRIVFASHGGLGCAMREAVSMILGLSVKEKTDCVDLLEGESLENYYEKLSSKVDPETIILADLFGGTPSRAALMLLQEGRAKAVITGFNMAIAIEILSNEDLGSNLQEFISRVKDAGLQGIRAFVGPQLVEISK
jgi:PTS system mannose-specific IIA component